MIKNVKIEKGIEEIQIKHTSGFHILKIVNANINHPKRFKGIPSVEMILLNDKAMFTSYSNLIPGTNTLNCFDLLLTASNNRALVNETFHTLKCILSSDLIDDSVNIELQFEIE